MTVDFQWRCIVYATVINQIVIQNVTSIGMVVLLLILPLISHVFHSQNWMRYAQWTASSDYIATCDIGSWATPCSGLRILPRDSSVAESWNSCSGLRILRAIVQWLRVGIANELPVLELSNISTIDGLSMITNTWLTVHDEFQAFYCRRTNLKCHNSMYNVFYESKKLPMRKLVRKGLTIFIILRLV